MAEENEQTTDVVVELEETPEVGHEGTVGHQATTAEMKAYAKSLLADEYDLTPKGQNVRQGDVIPGTDMPKDEHPDWETYTDNERRIALRSWENTKKVMQASGEQAHKIAAPMLRAVAIAQISEGLDDRARAALPKVIAEMEAESGQKFAPSEVTPQLIKQWQRIAKGAATEGPPTAPVLKKEPVGDAKDSPATADEKAYIEAAMREFKTELTLEQARAVMSNSKTQGYVMGPGGKN